MVRVFVGYTTPMLGRTQHIARSIQVLLTIIGSVALASGLFVAVLTITRTPANHEGIHPPVNGAIYVGNETCYSCHAGQAPDWSLKLDAQQAVASPVANPQIALTDVDIHAELQRHPLANDATESVSVLGDDPDRNSQRYVITTEIDPVLPPGHETDATIPCTDCHTVEPSAEPIPETNQLTLDCGSDHSQLARRMCSDQDPRTVVQAQTG